MPDFLGPWLTILGVPHHIPGHAKTCYLLSVPPRDWLHHSRMACGEAAEPLRLSQVIGHHAGRRPEVTQSQQHWSELCLWLRDRYALLPQDSNGRQSLYSFL